MATEASKVYSLLNIVEPYCLVQYVQHMVLGESVAGKLLL